MLVPVALCGVTLNDAFQYSIFGRVKSRVYPVVTRTPRSIVLTLVNFALAELAGYSAFRGVLINSERRGLVIGKA